MRLTIDRSDRSDRIQLKLIGELDMATARQLTEAFEVLPTGPYHLVVDVSELTFIDSTGVKAMLQGKAFLQVQGLTMVVTRPTYKCARSSTYSKRRASSRSAPTVPRNRQAARTDDRKCHVRPPRPVSIEGVARWMSVSSVGFTDA